MFKTKFDLLVAIGQLNSLITKKVNTESEYQRYLEENPIVFKILGYKRAIPLTLQSGIKLPKDDSGKQPAPDFLVINQQNLVEIFEIKTPYLKSRILLDGNIYREKFSAEIESYISQTMEYDDYFTRNPSNRAKVGQMIGVKIQEDLDITIVAGLNAGLDMGKIHKALRRRSRPIQMRTYDEILEALKDRYLELYPARLENGFMVHCLSRFFSSNTGSDAYIFDFGRSMDRNRVSLHVNTNGELVGSMFDSQGEYRSLVIKNVRYNLDQWYYLTIEFGTDGESVFYNISLDGEEYDLRAVQSTFDIALEIDNLVMGADLNYSNYGTFDMNKFAITPIPQPIDKFNVMDFMMGEIIKSKTKRIACMRFQGGQFVVRNKKTGALEITDSKYAPKVASM